MYLWHGMACSVTSPRDCSLMVMCPLQYFELRWVLKGLMNTLTCGRHGCFNKSSSPHSICMWELIKLVCFQNYLTILRLYFWLSLAPRGMALYPMGGYTFSWGRGEDQPHKILNMQKYKYGFFSQKNSINTEQNQVYIYFWGDFLWVQARGTFFFFGGGAHFINMQVLLKYLHQNWTTSILIMQRYPFQWHFTPWMQAGGGTIFKILFIVFFLGGGLISLIRVSNKYLYKF